MQLTFLGTGASQGVPIIGCKCGVCQSNDIHDKRLRTSALLSVNGLNIIFDAGPDFRTQLLRAHIDKLDAILLTHEHKDHIGGLDDVRAFNTLTDKAMPVKAELPYAFTNNRLPGVPSIVLHEIEANISFQVQDLTVLPIRVVHAQLPIIGFRIQNFAYITDANFVNNEAKNLLKGCKYLVINALQREQHLSHFTLAQALSLVKELKITQVFLTHISHRMGLYAKIQPILPANVHLSYDGLSVQFPR
ncbi:MAG: MBL fold metallo-hydrolase [Bacteroidales bacterium]